MLLKEIRFELMPTEVVGVYRISKPVAVKLAILASGESLIINADIEGKIWTDSKYAVTEVWQEDGKWFAEFVMVRGELSDSEAEEAWFACVDTDIRNAGWEEG